MFSTLPRRDGKPSLSGGYRRAPQRHPGDAVTIRAVSLVFALAISSIIIIGLCCAWPFSVIMFDLFLVVFGSAFLIRYC